MKGALPGLPSRGGAYGTGSRMARAPRDDAERRCGSGARRDGGSAGESLGQQRTRRRSGPLGGRKLGGPGPAESRPELREAGSACLQGHGASTRGEATSRGAGEGEAPQAVRPGRPGRMRHPPQGARDSGRLRGAGGRREARGETLKRREDGSVDSCDPTRVLRSAGRDHRRHPRGPLRGSCRGPGRGRLPSWGWGAGRGVTAPVEPDRDPWVPSDQRGVRFALWRNFTPQRGQSHLAHLAPVLPQIGDANPGLQKVTDALDSIKTKVRRARRRLRGAPAPHTPLVLESSFGRLQ